MDRKKLLQNPLPIDRVAARVVRAKGEHWNPLKVDQPKLVMNGFSISDTADERRQTSDYRRGRIPTVGISEGKSTVEKHKWSAQ